VDESKSAIKYPVIGVNLGGTGNFSIESRDGNPKQLNLKAGTGYVFGLNGINRDVFHRTFPGKQDSFLPELTTKLDGKTYEPGSYRISVTMRRVTPLENGMPESPAIQSAKPTVQNKKLFDSSDKELKKGSVVEYNGEKYLFWNKNVAGKAQLIKTDGSKFSGTPDVSKLNILGSYKTVMYNNTEYIVTDNNNIYSGATGNLVYTKSDPGSVAQKNRIIEAAKTGNLKSIKTEDNNLPLEYELKNQCKL
jgi:hypothetical protein